MTLPILSRLNMNALRTLILLGSVTVTSLALSESWQTDWGHISPSAVSGRFEAMIEKAQQKTRVALPANFGHVTHAHVVADGVSYSLEIDIHSRSNQVSLIIPKTARPQETLLVSLETGEDTSQDAHGRIVLSSKDANIVGETARLESNPGNYRIGFWSQAKDSVNWDYKASRPGMYDVFLTYSKASGNETSIRFAAALSQTTKTLTSTGSWYRYRTIRLGKVYIPKSGSTDLSVKCLKMDGGAVMNLKAITLKPSAEGNPIVQDIDGSITLHASDVTIQGVKVQYESLPHKNTVGYWVNESDWAYWEFTARQPGTFAVEILQGCGKGHGGSEVRLELGTEELSFNVEETGHFQNFVPRYVGQMTLKRPDNYRLAIKPTKKVAGAVMDLRRIRLVPVLK